MLWLEFSELTFILHHPKTWLSKEFDCPCGNLAVSSLFLDLLGTVDSSLTTTGRHIENEDSCRLCQN